MFNLIVTCVGSKHYEGPSIKNVINNLINKGYKNDIEALFDAWQRVLLQHMSSSFLPEVLDVYKGAMWDASMEAFDNINGSCQLWILSCGFGLINATEKISGYHATFKSKVDDSVYNRVYFDCINENTVKRKWWNLLSEKGIKNMNYPRSIHELINSSTSNDEILIAGGSDYYEAIYDDISRIDFSGQLPKLALVGIKKKNNGFKPDIPEKIIPYIQPYYDGRRLREFLSDRLGKCSAIQVHPKSASYLIKKYNETGMLHCTFPQY